VNDTRHRALTAGAITISAALALLIGVQLSGYGVPIALLLACCLPCMATFSSLLFRVVSDGQCLVDDHAPLHATRL
jgi:hypothetical protein